MCSQHHCISLVVIIYDRALRSIIADLIGQLPSVNLGRIYGNDMTQKAGPLVFWKMQLVFNLISIIPTW